jgi:hypothetical protein
MGRIVRIAAILAAVAFIVVAADIVLQVEESEERARWSSTHPAVEGVWEGERAVGADGRLTDVEGRVTFREGRWSGGLRMRDTLGPELPVDSGGGRYRLRGDTLLLEDGEEIRVERAGDRLTLVGIEGVRVQLRRR